MVDNDLKIEESIEEILVDVQEDQILVSETNADNTTDVPVTPVINIEELAAVNVTVQEAFGVPSGTRIVVDHNTSSPNQHTIGAITGLREELDDIKSLKTVYSSGVNVANYYKWYGDNTYDDSGYFVSLVPGTSTIKICDGSDIFGVSVNSAGFVGNPNATIPRERGNDYALVATDGLVDVRCESTVAEGDYVISNASGVAEKTTSGCGYKVIAVNDDRTHDPGVLYATIALGAQACITDTLGKNLQHLETRVSNNEINIATAMNVANDAYNKSVESGTVSEEAVLKALDALALANDAKDATEETNKILESVKNTAIQAKAIAESAVTEAESIRKEAYDTANDALSNVNALIEGLEPIAKWGTNDEYITIDTWDEAGKDTTQTYYASDTKLYYYYYNGAWVSVDELSRGAEYLTTYIKDGLATKVEVDTVETITEENRLLIEKNAESFQTIVSSVDKYSVGKYSQAYGLTLEQAGNILKPGMIYIPTKHGDIATHIEKYEGSPDRYFTAGYFYEWVELEDGSLIWSEEIGEVYFNAELPAGDTFTYWYDNTTLYKFIRTLWFKFDELVWNNTSEPTDNKYRYWFDGNTTHVLTIKETGERAWSDRSTFIGEIEPAWGAYDFWYDGSILYSHWSEVATLAGNVNNRITSMIRQDVDEVRAEVVNAYGAVAGFGAKLSDTEAKVHSIASWPTGDEKSHHMAILEQTADEDGHPHMVLATVRNVGVNGEEVPEIEELGGAKIVLDDTEKGSFIQIEADNIVLNGKTSFTTLDETDGETKINGAHMATGSIDATAVKVQDLSAFKATIAGWKIDKEELFYQEEGSNFKVGLSPGKGDNDEELGLCLYAGEKVPAEPRKAIAGTWRFDEDCTSLMNSLMEFSLSFSFYGWFNGNGGWTRHNGTSATLRMSYGSDIILNVGGSSRALMSRNSAGGIVDSISHVLLNREIGFGPVGIDNFSFEGETFLEGFLSKATFIRGSVGLYPAMLDRDGRLYIQEARIDGSMLNTDAFTVGDIVMANNAIEYGQGWMGPGSFYLGKDGLTIGSEFRVQPTKGNLSAGCINVNGAKDFVDTGMIACNNLYVTKNIECSEAISASSLQTDGNIVAKGSIESPTIQSLKAENTALKNRVYTLETDYTLLEYRVYTLETETIARLEERLTKLEERLEELEA